MIFFLNNHKKQKMFSFTIQKGEFIVKPENQSYKFYKNDTLLFVLKEYITSNNTAKNTDLLNKINNYDKDYTYKLVDNNLIFTLKKINNTHIENELIINLPTLKKKNESIINPIYCTKCKNKI